MQLTQDCTTKELNYPNAGQIGAGTQVRFPLSILAGWDGSSWRERQWGVFSCPPLSPSPPPKKQTNKQQQQQQQQEAEAILILE